MNTVIAQGLRITTHCRYFKFTKSRWLSVTENFDKSVIEIKFPRGFRSSDIVDRRIEVLKDFELIETDFTRIKKVLVNLNGLVLTKLVTDVYNYSQLLVEDIDDFIMDFDELQCKILIPKTRNFDTQTYLDLISKNPYLEIVDSSELEVLANYYNINIVNEDVVINSTNEFVFSAKKKYSKYLLEMIDIQDSFNTQLSGILKDYGVELIRYPIDSNVHNVNHIVFRITDLGAQESHKTDQFPLRYAVQHKATIDFELTFPDLVMYSDFKTRYQNVDLVSNFTEFYTEDKLGVKWISSIKWNPISTDFEQDYAQDNQGNVSFKASFSAELYYYVVYDEMFYNIQTTILSLLALNKDNEVGYSTDIITNLR